MLTETELRLGIIGIDLDDTVFEREWITRFSGFLRGRVKRLSLPNYTLDTLPDIDHTPIERPMSWREKISLHYHKKRKVIPGVAQRLKALADQGVIIIALSGRHATKEWYEMTMDQLNRAGIPVSELILTPDKVSTSVSKAHGILNTGVEVFYDDDLRTQYYLSGLFPDVRFDWIYYRLTNIPAKKEMLEVRTNLRVTPFSEWRQR